MSLSLSSLSLALSFFLSLSILTLSLSFSLFLYLSLSCSFPSRNSSLLHSTVVCPIVISITVTRRGILTPFLSYRHRKFIQVFYRFVVEIRSGVFNVRPLATCGKIERFVRPFLTVEFCCFLPKGIFVV